MKARLFAAFLIALVPLFIHGDTMTAGKLVWSAQYQKNNIITVTQGVSAETGRDLIEVWVDPQYVYQEFYLNSAGYNGSLFICNMREVRPGQHASEIAGHSGMRDPSSMFRAPKVAFGTVVEQPGGVFVFLEIREIGENYLIVVTKIIPRANEQPKAQEM